MTDHDRGAYTPQTDAPLAFDARRVRGAGGGPAPVTLVISAAVGLLLLIATLLFYRSGVRPSGQPPQVVGAPVGQTKAPPGDAAASNAAPTVQIETTPPGETKSPTYASGPEAPMTRTASSAPAPSAASPSSSAGASLRQAQSEPSPPPTASDLPAPAKTAPSASDAHLAPALGAPPITPAKRVKAVKTAALKPAVEPPAAATPTPGEPLVQIGAFTSAELARKGWHDTAAVLPGRMGGRTARVEKTERDGKTFYRSYVGGFSSHAQAVSFCEALKAAGKSCIVR